MYLFFPEKTSTEDGGHPGFLCAARASIEKILEAVDTGDAPKFKRYQNASFRESGLGGECIPLETGNPFNRSLSVSYNTALDRFIMITAFTNIRPQALENDLSGDTILQLATSPDGSGWSSRATLHRAAGEMFYPTIIDVRGNLLRTGGRFYVYYTVVDNWGNRWKQARLERLTVDLERMMITKPHRWEFTSAGDRDSSTSVIGCRNDLSTGSLNTFTPVFALGLPQTPASAYLGALEVCEIPRAIAADRPVRPGVPTWHSTTTWSISGRHAAAWVQLWAFPNSVCRIRAQKRRTTLPGLDQGAH